MEVTVGNQRVLLQGGPHLSESELTKSGLRRLVSRNVVAYFCHLRSENPEPREPMAVPELKEVLNEFKDILAEPTELPPEKITNHRIKLLPGSEPVNVHPYRYPHYQKSEIEKLTMEMLNQSLIRHSVSPFSSPVLLVKKRTAVGASVSIIGHLMQ